MTTPAASDDSETYDAQDTRVPVTELAPEDPASPSCPPAAPLPFGVGTGAFGLDRDDDGPQIVQGVREARIRQLVPGLTADRNGHHEATVTEACQVVRQPGPRDTEGISQIRGMRRRLAQREEQPHLGTPASRRDGHPGC